VRLARVDGPLLLGEALRGLPEDGVLLVFGYDFSFEVAYYAQRAAITLPAWPRSTSSMAAHGHARAHRRTADRGGRRVPNLLRDAAESGRS
jgi:hypothetical protein